MCLPSAVSKQKEIDAAIQRARQSIGPDVVRIRYQIGEDWSGQCAIFLRSDLRSLPGNAGPENHPLEKSASH
jgi:hypothetical protein